MQPSILLVFTEDMTIYSWYEFQMNFYSWHFWMNHEWTLIYMYIYMLLYYTSMTFKCVQGPIGPWYFYIDWLIVYWFTSCSRIFHSNRDVTIVNTGLQRVCLFARRWRSLNREGSVSCHTQCDTWPRFTRSRPKNLFSLYLASIQEATGIFFSL